MGNRVKGRVKKKSIKAAISSGVGSKRKLSRMGKNKKKDLGGLYATFIGRAKCLKLLQINLKDFRRLCILKGIYPREPVSGKVPGNKKSQSFYHMKDIRSIAHEPILEKFREFKAFMKKVRRASGRNEVDEANRKNAMLPKYSLHHIVKDRYPRFVDALADVDDCLTLTYLFAALPSDNTNKLPSSKLINKAKQLAAGWGAYCATTSCITKQFVSVKGIYMEAVIQSTTIRWIIPHAFTQFIPDDVDFRIMNTFFELYQVMLDFILYKLYTDIGVRYPLALPSDVGTATSTTTTSLGAAGTTSAILGSNLIALKNALDNTFTGGAISNVVSEAVQKQQSEGVQSQNNNKTNKKNNDDVNPSGKKSKELVKSVSDALNKLSDSEDDNGMDDDDDDDDSVDVAGPLKAALDKISEDEARVSLISRIGGTAITVDDETIQRKRLFQGFTFFISREVPRGYIELICLSYGAKAVGWEHGPNSPISMKDPSITHHIVDRPRLPITYETLPKSREYIQPQWIFDCANFLFLLPVGKYVVGATLPPHLSPWVDDEEEGYKPAYAEEIERLKNGEAIEEEERSVDEADEPSKPVDGKTKLGKAPDQEKEDKDESSSDEDVADVEEEEEEDEEELKQRLERKRVKEAEETHKLAKSMMSRKASHLYGRMQHGLAQKKSKTDKLHERRKALDDEANKVSKKLGISSSDKDIIKGKEKDDSGKSALKQKVERLKRERKTIETTYDKTGGYMKKSKKNRK